MFLEEHHLFFQGDDLSKKNYGQHLFLTEKKFGGLHLKETNTMSLNREWCLTLRLLPYHRKRKPNRLYN